MRSLRPTPYALRPKIFVALSGGVDSAVSAALLKEAGYDVTGVFMKVWSPDWLPCPWPEERRDAMRVAAHLQIPFHTFDFSDEYKRHVADYMIEEYRRGRVPNPDVMCNKFVKFDAFLHKSLEMEADMIATGHYGRVRQNTKHKEHKTPDSATRVTPADAEIQILDSYQLSPAVKHKTQNTELQINPNFYNLRSTPYALLRGVDTAKDQSYFLWTLTQAQLSRTLFPIGHLTKPEVRAEAERFGLPVAEKKDSQGVCFLGQLDMKDFLRHYIDEKKGDVVNESGEVIGHHPGATFFTLGERRGFTITKKTPTDLPYYVVGKDIGKNELIVSHDRSFSKHKTQNTKLQRDAITLEQVNWTSGEAPDPFRTHKARWRYRQSLQECRIEYPHAGQLSIVDCQLSVRFCEPQEPMAPGQSLVLYDKKGEECFGGGIIA